MKSQGFVVHIIILSLNEGIQFLVKITTTISNLKNLFYAEEKLLLLDCRHFVYDPVQ